MVENSGPNATLLMQEYVKLSITNRHSNSSHRGLGARVKARAQAYNCLVYNRQAHSFLNGIKWVECVPTIVVLLNSYSSLQ